MEYYKSIPELKNIPFGKKGWVPSVSQLNLRGIEWYKVVQKPGEIVYAPSKSIHWVLSPVSVKFFIFLTIFSEWRSIYCMEPSSLEYG